jgi:hypothetical protein
MLGLSDPVAAYCLDEALFVRHRLAQAKDQPDAEGELFGEPPPENVIALLPTVEG